jgi:hypothetical protein
MKYLLIILVVILSSCTKATTQDCYICTFGTITVGTQRWSPDPEVHCEPGAKNYKKYLTVPGTVINNWQFPTSCKLK